MNHRDRYFQVAPSLLSADFSRLGDEVIALQEAGADWVHVDVMDGHFVPNLTIGAPVVKSLRKVTKLVLDCHLMVERPWLYIESFAQAGADIITVHIEAAVGAGGLTASSAGSYPEDAKIENILKKIRNLNKLSGLSLKPRTPVSLLYPLLPLVDVVLVMTVEPGFGGQSFMADQASKCDELRQEIDRQGLKTLIEVDGGINAETAKTCRTADVLVAGNYIFAGVRSHHPSSSIHNSTHNNPGANGHQEMRSQVIAEYSDRIQRLKAAAAQRVRF